MIKKESVVGRREEEDGQRFGNSSGSRFSDETHWEKRMATYFGYRKFSYLAICINWVLIGTKRLTKTGIGIS